MNFEKYAKAEFEKLSPEEARSLADEAQEGLLNEIDCAIKDAFKAAIAEFNAVGHNLTLYDEASGELAYRDPSGFRLAIDSIVSSGYRDTVDDST